MTITVKFFARLRDEFGRGAATVDYAPDMTVSQVWRAVADGRGMPAGTLVAVNHEHVKGDARLGDGDEVAFFPPVTGG